MHTREFFGIGHDHVVILASKTPSSTRVRMRSQGRKHTLVRFEMIVDVIRRRIRLGVATDVRVTLALVYSYVVDEIFRGEYHA